MSTAQRFKLRIESDDQEPIEIYAGQREMASWEREPFGCSSLEAAEVRPMVFFRYLAYSALKRTWQLKKIEVRGELRTPTFDEWGETVDTVDVADEKKDEPDDPSKTDQPPAG